MPPRTFVRLPARLVDGGKEFLRFELLAQMGEWIKSLALCVCFAMHASPASWVRLIAGLKLEWVADITFAAMNSALHIAGHFGGPTEKPIRLGTTTLNCQLWE
jgi:hypothetical protein